MSKINFNAGDYVKFRLTFEEIEGIVLECSDSSIVLIKLDSGYNIAIKKENILDSRVLKRFQIEREERSVEDKKILKNNLPSIGLIICGGTIAAKMNPKKGGVSWLTNLNEFMEFYPDIFKMVNVKEIAVPFMVASESMKSEHWIEIAKNVKRMLDDDTIRGVVITHGTDFLGYTAAALSFFLRDLGKPVVLTYSQRSIDRASSDANLNLRCAVQMALSDVAEVMIVGHATINDDFCYAIRGIKARKLHSSRRDAFKSVNAEPIAKVWSDKIEFLSSFNKRDSKKRNELDAVFCDKIALIKFYPGQDSSIIDFCALKNKGAVIEAAGLGHLPVGETTHNWIPSIKKHIKDGFIVCITSQTIFGRVDPFVYSNGRELLNAGVIFLEDMLSETAFVKLGWALGHNGWKTRIKEIMLENFAGELNKRLIE